jgi:hypothetical protein
MQKKKILKKVNVAPNALKRHATTGEKVTRPAKNRMIPSPEAEARADVSEGPSCDVNVVAKAPAARPDGIRLHFGLFHI